MKLSIAIAAFGIAGLVGTAHAQGPTPDPNLARNLAATCANCHGTNGKSLGGLESLAGEPKEKLMQKLADRGAGIMMMHYAVECGKQDGSGDRFRSALGNDTTTAGTTLRSQINDPVGGFDDV